MSFQLYTMELLQQCFSLGMVVLTVDGRQSVVVGVGGRSRRCFAGGESLSKADSLGGACAFALRHNACRTACSRNIAPLVMSARREYSCRQIESGCSKTTILAQYATEYGEKRNRLHKKKVFTEMVAIEY
jgi:hypothetical protein